MTYNVMGLHQGGVCHCHLNWKSGIKDRIFSGTGPGKKCRYRYQKKFWVRSHSYEDINLWPLSIRRLLLLQVGQVHCCATNPILLMITMRITIIMMAGYLKGECIAISCCVVICVSLEIIKNLHHI